MESNSKMPKYAKTTLKPVSFRISVALLASVSAALLKIQKVKAISKSGLIKEAVKIRLRNGKISKPVIYVDNKILYILSNIENNTYQAGRAINSLMKKGVDIGISPFLIYCYLIAIACFVEFYMNVLKEEASAQKKGRVK